MENMGIEKEFEVTYFECYSQTYTVKAKNAEEAKEKVRNGIFEGEYRGPDNCYDSGFSDVTEL